MNNKSINELAFSRAFNPSAFLCIKLFLNFHTRVVSDLKNLNEKELFNKTKKSSKVKTRSPDVVKVAVLSYNFYGKEIFKCIKTVYTVCKKVVKCESFR